MSDSSLSVLLEEFSLWVDQCYCPRPCPQCGSIIHAKRSRSGNKMYWGCFNHPSPIWCGSPVIIPPTHLDYMDLHHRTISAEIEKMEQQRQRAQEINNQHLKLHQQPNVVSTTEIDTTSITNTPNIHVNQLNMSQTTSAADIVNDLWQHLSALSFDPPASSSDAGVNNQLCKICVDQSMDCVLVPCGHLCICMQCAIQVTQCPICRSQILNRQKIYKV